MFGGAGREGNSYYRYITNMVYGTPNSAYAQSGWSRYGPRCAETGFFLGGGYPEYDYAQKFADRYDHPSWTAPEVVLFWGKGPLESNADWVEKWTYGFDEFAERMRDMPPAKAAEICGVPEEQIIRAARLYGNAKPSSLAWGLAVDQNPNGVQLGQCLIALMSITGYLDAPGGTLLGSIENRNQKTASKEAVNNAGSEKVENHSSQQAALDNDIMSLETWNKRIGLQEFPGVCMAIPTAHPDCILDALETSNPARSTWRTSPPPTRSARPSAQARSAGTRR